MQAFSRFLRDSKGSLRYGLEHSFSTSLRIQQHRPYVAPPFINRPDNQVTVKVKIGIGRGAELRITYPPKPEANGPVILDLGRGVPTQAPCNHTRELSLSSNATIIEPNYRISREYTYPAPIHMTLAAFDWISRTMKGDQERLVDTKSPRIGVCGELAGGSLAAMLALTECNTNKAHISAAAIGNAILDWTDVFPPGRDMTIDDIQSSDHENLHNAKALSSTDEEALSISAFIASRKEFFRKAEAFFDPFASPTLFFRTPCFDLPFQFSLNPLLKASAILNDGSSSDVDDESQVLTRKRLYPRVYPPPGSNLVFPSMRLTLGEDFVLGNQATELAELMRRSMARGQGLVSYAGEKDTSKIVTTERKHGLGLWEPNDAMEIGQWFGDVLR